MRAIVVTIRLHDDRTEFVLDLSCPAPGRCDGHWWGMAVQTGGGTRIGGGSPIPILAQTASYSRTVT